VKKLVAFSDNTGILERYENFASNYIEPRHVDVWCPPGYTAHPDQRYPVIYMGDGQNLFDPSLSYIGVDWGVDEAIARLLQEGTIRAPIVVGVWNTFKRWREYMPQKAYDKNLSSVAQAQFNAKAGGRPTSDYYLRFLVEELKPLIDENYRTLPGRDDTFIMGSSMGALLALYAVVSYPEIFSGAACLSTHWLAGEDGMVAAMSSMLPAVGTHRFYFDYGTLGLDAGYEPYQRKMDQGLRDAGYNHGQDWVTLKFDDADHSEAFWRERAHIPLKFLLGC